MSNGKQRTIILVNQINPEPITTQNNENEFFQYVDSGVSFAPRPNIMKMRDLFQRIVNLLQDIYYLIESEDLKVEKPDFWSSVTNVIINFSH